MNSKKRRIPGYKIVALLIFGLAYVLSMIKLTSFDNQDDIGSGMIVLYSWFGILTFLFYIVWWKKLTGKIMTPFTIFLLFVTVFNFGQCFLWAFGIHTNSNLEIGNKLIFSSISANNALILKAQILYIISFIALNTGGILLYGGAGESTIGFLKKDGLDGIKYKALFITSIVTSVYSIPVTLYVAIQKLRYSQIFSYHDLYYGSVSNAFNSPFFAIGCGLFFISLIGLLIGSRYKKRVVYFVYSIFSIYALITLFGGDRGEWIMPFIFLFWMHISFYKPMKKKAIVILFVVSLISLYVMNAIVSLRNIGLSYEGFTTALTENDGAIKPLLLEFGHTMGISIILLKNQTVSPYGNTILMSVPTALGTGLGNQLFGMNYVQLHTWFPLEYLKISYGTDFSIIGEALLNYGVLLTPLVLFIEGLIFGKIFNYPFKKKKSPFVLCVMLNAMICIIGIARSTVWITLNKIVISTLFFAVAYFIIKSLVKNKDNSKSVKE